MILLALLDADAEVHSLDDAAVHGWSLPLVPFVGLTVLLLLYWRGLLAARKTRELELPWWRAGAFTAGCATMWLALASPIDALDDVLLVAHMTQHFILMSIAPPLMILGAPVVPLLRGLPRWLVRGVVGPLMSLRWVHAVSRFVTHPATIWLAMNLSYIIWHIPGMFELTFTSERIHDFEHLCFFITSLGFWWVVLAPWPAEPRWPRWSVIPYLLVADLVNTALSGTLMFSGKVLYPSYAAAERVSSLTPLQDQIAAGGGMWVFNSIVMLIPAFFLTIRMLSPRRYAKKKPVAGKPAQRFVVIPEKGDQPAR
ncbi:MAG: cytochrome c oxidase assembly protein [Acidobacteriaceae bacterium]|nr:cytochrome c oxidase assembly protein [Acidobacteriaceae bacterium]